MTGSRPARERADREFKLRSSRDDLLYALVLLPVGAYAAVSYLHLRTLSIPALLAGAAAYAVVVWLLARRSRAQLLEAMRREGTVGERYSPPD